MATSETWLRRLLNARVVEWHLAEPGASLLPQKSHLLSGLYPRWDKSRFTAVCMQNTEFMFVLLFINDRIIIDANNCKSAFTLYTQGKLKRLLGIPVK